MEIMQRCNENVRTQIVRLLLNFLYETCNGSSVAKIVKIRWPNQNNLSSGAESGVMSGAESGP